MTATAGQGGPGLAFAMLGPLQVARDGQRLALGGRQQRAVLAALLTQAGRALSAGRLADALWPEDARAGSVATVQTYVFHLREILEPDRARGEPWTVLMTEPGGYRLDVDASTVDAREFEIGVESARAGAARGDYEEADKQLGRALALWRDDVLVDLADLPFVEPVAARLTALRLDGYELRARCQLELDRPDAAVTELDRLVAEHPLREQLHAQRILALYRCGRQSEALAAYRDLHRVLDEELGVEPSPALRQLHQAVLAQDPALDWQAPPQSPDGEAPALGAAPALEEALGPEPPGTPGSRRRRVGRSLRRHRGVTAIGAVGLVLALGAGIAVVADRSGHETATALAADSVGIVDEHGGLGVSIPVGANPDAMTYGDGSVWVASRTENTVTRVDPRTHGIVQKIPTGATPAAVAVTNHDLWVANFRDGTVWRISTLNYQVSKIGVGNEPIALASGPSGVWVANYADDTVQRIDPSSGAVDAPIPVGRGPAALAVDRDSVWVAASLDDTVTELDANAGKQLGLPSSRIQDPTTLS